MQIFFGNLKLDLQHYLKEFPLPQARSPRATAFECIDMIELQMSISVYTHFLTHAFCQGTVPMTRQENHSGNSQKKKYQFAKCSSDDTYCRLRPLLKK